MGNVSNQLKKEVDDAFSSLPTDNFQGTQKQNELRQILTKVTALYISKSEEQHISLNTEFLVVTLWSRSLLFL